MKNLFVSLLAAASILTPGVAKAQNSSSDHLQLWNALQQVGVTTFYNHPIHCHKDKKVDGLYYPYSAMLVVCQDNMTTPSKEQDWTPNDFDTLRHEAHHVVQDCAYGVLGDGRMGPMFTNDELVTFLDNSSYSYEQLNALYESLKGRGLNDMSIQEEMEAHVVASDIPAETISAKVIEFCTK